MKTKSWILAFVGLLLMGSFFLSFGIQTKPIELGKIVLPRDVEWRTEILTKGEYGLFLIKDEISLVYRDKNIGLEHCVGFDTEVEEVKEKSLQSKVDVNAVTEEGKDYVQIRVFWENKIYRALLRCALGKGEETKEVLKTSPIDPAIETELKLLKEARILLGRFAEEIWPGWEGYKNLDFMLTFPNKAILLLTRKERVPQDFKILPGEAIDGKKAYINRTKELPGRIGFPMVIQGHGDIGGITAFLMGPLETAESKPLSGKKSQVATKKVVYRGRGQGEPLLEARSEEYMRLSRMLVYVHEAYHCYQAKFMLEREKASLKKDRGEMNQDFDVNLEYSVYADIEGEALLKAFQETDETKALEYFKDSLVAREIKQKAMPSAVVIADLLKTRDEGTATYANLQMAILIKKTGYQSEAAKNDEVISSAFKHVDDYIKKEAVSSLEATAGKTLEVAQRFYIYGAIQCLLLDRFLPQWKKGFFENDRTLDEVAAGSLNLSEGDKQRIAERLKTDFSFNEIWARHRQVIQNRDNAIQLVMNRKGKKYLIDVKHAQQGFNIEPRELVLCRQEQIYPHGLRGFVFGSLKLISQDTPMRFITAQYVLEWIDTEAKEGEKGYELKYETKDGDLYKNVTLTTKGFTLTAKAINIVEEVDLVKIQIRD